MPARHNAAAIPLDTLREQIAQAVAEAKAHEVPAVCVRLGIQAAVEADDADEAFRSKRLYVRKRVLSWNEADLLALAARVLREYASEALADTVSEMTAHAEHRVSELVRRDVLKVLDRLPNLFGDLPLIDSLSEVFGASVIQDDPGELLGRRSLQGQILQHYVRNETDWSHEEMLTQCGVLTCSQTRFFALLAKVLHPVVRRDDEQGELAAALSIALRRDGFVMRQTDC